MKKIFNTMMAAAIAAFTFTACEDVPEPYNNPYDSNTDEPGVTVEPTGDGSETTPWNVVAALDACADLGAGEYVNNGDDVYVTGVITQIDELSTSYGNATYYISDNLKSGYQLEVYRGYSLNGDKFTSDSEIEVGDSVTVCGKIVYYNGSVLEFTTGSKLVYLKKGEGGGNTDKPEVSTVGSKDAPKTVAEALAAINAMSDGATSAEYWYVKGKVVRVTTSQANFDQYKNLNYLISEDGTETNTITVYAGNGLDNAQFSSVDALKAGDEVVVYGQLQKYVNNSGNMTPEIAKGNYLVKHTPADGSGSTPTDPANGNGTADSPYNVTGALAAGSGTGVYVKGYIVGSVDGQVLSTGAMFSATSVTQTNLLIAASDGETNVNNCMPVQLPSGAIRTALNLMDNAGNYKKEVTLYGNIEKYFGVTGLKTVTYAVLDGKEIGVNPGGGTTTEPTEGTGTIDNPLTPSQAYDIVLAMPADQTSTEDYYVKGKISSIKYTFSAQYGTATFNISDDGSTGGKEFAAYSCLYFGGQKWKDGDTQVNVGDEVIVCGKVVNYYGNTPEFASQKNYLVSLNGNTGGNTGGGNEGGNTGGDAGTGATATITMADFGLENAAELTTLSANGVTLTFSAEGGSTTPKYYDSGNAARMYALNSLTITGSKAISKVVLTCAMNGTNPANGNDMMYGEAGGTKVTTRKDSDTQVTFSNFSNNTLKIVNDHSAASGGTQLRIVSLQVTYAN